MHEHDAGDEQLLSPCQERGEDLVFVCSLSCYMNKHEEPGVETQEEAEQRPDPDFCPTCETDWCDWIT